MTKNAYQLEVLLQSTTSWYGFWLYILTIFCVKRAYHIRPLRYVYWGFNALFLFFSLNSCTNK